MKRELKKAAQEKAQEMLMHGIGNVMGYWYENPNNCEDVEVLGLSNEEFATIMWSQADRVAKMFGYIKAWSN